MATGAIRLKSRWFRDGAARPPAEQAGAMGFTLWRVGRQVLERMRGAGFAIDAGAPYFDFLAEVLAFLLVVADRLAHARLATDERVVFTTALVRHVASTFQDNVVDLLGEPAPGRPSPADVLIDRFNGMAEQAADCGAAPGADEFSPDLAMLRLLAARLEPTLPPPDRHWVLDQLVAVQVPEAVTLLQRAMRELHSTEPRRARREGFTGD